MNNLFAVSVLLQDTRIMLTEVGQFEGEMIVNHAWAANSDIAVRAVLDKISSEFPYHKRLGVIIHHIPEAIRS